MTEEELLTIAISRIDQENRGDPNKERYEGIEYPKELLYSQRMTVELSMMAPDAGVPLRLAARAQHIGRWTSPRASYPMDRVGYLRWRTDLKKYHAERAESILRETGFDVKTIDRTKALIRKESLADDNETQILEDVICIVFLKYYLAQFAKSHEADKTIDILRKTWKKMSENGQNAALSLKLDPEEQSLINAALFG